MEEHFENAINLLKKQDIDACITGSCMLGYNKDWQQDIDVFCYSESSFNKLLFFFHYNDLFQILDPLEKHKFDSYINHNDSSIKSIGLITIKFKYNMLIDINVIFKKFQNNIFDVVSNFDLDIIATGYDIKSKKTLDLRESTDMNCTWNKWNKTFYETSNFWNIKRILRQFERVIKYNNRGYDVTEVIDKYLEIVKEVLDTENFYKSNKGVKYFEDTVDQFKVVYKILTEWKKTKTITEEELLLLKTLI